MWIIFKFLVFPFNVNFSIKSGCSSAKDLLSNCVSVLFLQVAKGFPFGSTKSLVSPKRLRTFSFSHTSCSLSSCICFLVSWSFITLIISSYETTFFHVSAVGKAFKKSSGCPYCGSGALFFKTCSCQK